MDGKKVIGFIKCLLAPRACRQTSKLLFEFVEGDLDEPTRQKLQAHLSDCPTCLNYVESYRHIIEVTHRHGVVEVEMPPELRRKLQQFIHENPQLK